MEDDLPLSPEAEALRTLKHDIRNQLSNINLALEQMRYELPEESGDCPFYLDLIKGSCASINELLKEG